MKYECKFWKKVVNFLKEIKTKLKIKKASLLNQNVHYICTKNIECRCWEKGCKFSKRG